MDLNLIYKEINENLQSPEKNFSKLNIFYSSAFYYLICNLILIILALIKADHLIFATGCVYLFAGYFIYRQKRKLYWQIKTGFHLFIKAELFHFLFAGIILFLITFMLGWQASLPKKSDISILFILQAAICGPAFEELFFREYLFGFRIQGASFSKILFYMTVSSCFFYMVHINGFAAMDINSFLVYFSAGMCLSFLRFVSKNLLLPFLTHCGINVLMIAAV